MKKTTILALALTVLCLPAFAQLKLNGAGATFPYVIYSKWFDVYSKKIRINKFEKAAISVGVWLKYSIVY